MNFNLEVAQKAQLRPIVDVARGLALGEDDLELYGRYKAKVSLDVLERRPPRGKLVLVTAMTPTPAGEGKTTVTVGLSMALNGLGTSALCATREPSIGPVFGMKGGASGGGYSQVLPMEDINLHFTGDMHAVGTAHNLLVAMLDNSLYHGNPHNVDVRAIPLRRVMDMNDRSLRNIVLGLGGRANGVPREGAFMITSASEVMAALCLSSGRAELKERLGRMVVGLQRDGRPITASDLKAAGAMAAVLKDAIKPNLVQTVSGTPALIHGGPFGNIAHGTNSIVATRLGLGLVDVVVTEAGFGSDLGAEKFCNLVSRVAGVAPSAFVVVATIRALKMHGGKSKNELTVPDAAAVERGLPNLERHVSHLRQYGVPAVVAVNHFDADTEDELKVVLDWCQQQGVAAAGCNPFQQGGDGVQQVGRLVQDAMARPSEFKPLYELDSPFMDKLNTIATQVYRAERVHLEDAAQQRLLWLEREGYGKLPLCMAKTQYSFTDDPTRRGAPTNFTLSVRDLDVSAGAGFIVVYSGSILVMPGLPKVPSAEAIDITDKGDILGLF